MQDRFMMGELVSVVIPVYNAAKYLDECLNSVTQQRYANIEIILENDGSKDESLLKCQTWKQKDKRIKVFDHENWGVSKTRNHAMSQCAGKYIAFVDADDIIGSAFIDTLVTALESTNAECAVVHHTSGSQCQQSSFSEGKTVTAAGEACAEVLFGPCQGFLANKLYRMEIIREHNLCLDEQVAVMEDMLFNAQYFQYCKTVAINDGVQYFYRQQNGSAVNRLDNVRWFDGVHVYKELLKLYSQNIQAASAICYAYANWILEAKYRVNYIDSQKAAVLKPQLKEELKTFNFKHQKWSAKQKIKLLLFWLFPNAVMKYKRRMLK